MPTTPRSPGPPAHVHEVGVLNRTAHALTHWWPKHPAPAPPTRQAQLVALATLLDEAVAAQPLADRAVAACGETAPVPGAVAQDAELHNAVYHRLTVRLRGMRLDEDLTPLGERAARLLAYHEWILHQAVNLAFTSQPSPGIEAARRRLNGLGRPATDLRELRDEIQQRAAQASAAAGTPRPVLPDGPANRIP